MIDELDFKASRPFVGVFDSGVGGISVLAALMRELPSEDYVYFGDSAYTPYGEKPSEWVIDRSREIASSLIQADAKAIVVACNTATAVAVQTLRQEFRDTPIIGVEPALKPATEAAGIDRILVMATPITIHQDKYVKLAQTYTGNHDVVSVECPGLASRIEQGNLDSPDLTDFVRSLVGDYRNKVDAVVLGCTHYAFIAPIIKDVVGDVVLFDGAKGTARQVRRLLQEKNLLTPSTAGANVQFFTSGVADDSLVQYERFLQAARDSHFVL